MDYRYKISACLTYSLAIVKQNLLYVRHHIARGKVSKFPLGDGRVSWIS